MQILHRLRGRLLTAGVFCALFATVAFSHQNERKTSAILSGTVVDSGTIQPIVGAHVVLKLGRIPQRDSTEENPVAEVLTDSRGHFQFDSLKPGEYSFFANKRGCLHSTLQVISLESGRIASREVDLDCLAKISGRVVTEAGHPIGGARVTALVGLMGAGVALTRMLNESGAAGLMTTSDSGGRFELFWPAEEGEVTLFAEALDYAPTRARVVRSGAE